MAGILWHHYDFMPVLTFALGIGELLTFDCRVFI